MYAQLSDRDPNPSCLPFAIAHTTRPTHRRLVCESLVTGLSFELYVPIESEHSRTFMLSPTAGVVITPQIW